MNSKLILLLLFIIGCKSNSIENKKASVTVEKQRFSSDDTLTFNYTDTIKPLKLPIFIDIHTFSEDSIVGQKLKIIKRKALEGYNISGKLFTKDNNTGLIRTDLNNIIWLYIYNVSGRLISKTAITPLIKILPDQIINGKYFMITTDFDIESGFIATNAVIDKDSTILATVKSQQWIEKYKIDSIGQIKKIKITPHNILYKPSVLRSL